MHIDPTQYALHNGSIDAIELDTVTQTLILYIEMNLAIAVTYNETNNVDDFRQTRLIFRGVSEITPPLPLFADGGDDPTRLYGDIYDLEWNTATPPQAVLLAEINYGFKGHQDVIKSTIIYETVEWQIDPAVPPAAGQ